jgi:hypothetical protein
MLLLPLLPLLLLPPPPNHLGSCLCPVQEDFKTVVKDHQGFEYRPERPGGSNFRLQKFGWSGLVSGEFLAASCSTMPPPY